MSTQLEPKLQGKMRPITAALIATLWPLAVLAANTTDRQSELNTAMGNAAALFADGKVAVAEQRLTALNNAKQGTAQWCLEAAQRLLSMGNYFQGQHQGAVVDQIASRALAQTDLAINKSANDPALQARAQLLAGAIREQLLHDRESALVNFKEAQRLDPNAPGAARAVGRLNLASDEHGRSNKHN